MKKIRKPMSPYIILLIGFLALIILGSILLKLPISIKDGVELSWVDSFFISTSAVCVTGLAPVFPAATFTVFGKIILALLIELGGLGFVTVVMFIFSIIGLKINFSDRQLIKEAMNQTSASGMIRLVRNTIKISLSIQLIGAVLYFISFIQDYDFIEALGYAVFHSISAFNNAGFDILGNASFAAYSNDILFNLTTTTLIILGGIGFIVIYEIMAKKSLRNLSMHTKIVLEMTFFLLVVGTLFIKLTSYADISWLQAFFMSVNSRTAGFSTIDIGILSKASIFVIIILMFIGASPSSTGGGIKTTTLFTIIKSIGSYATGKAETRAFNRRISDYSIIKSYILAFSSVAFVSCCFLVMMLIEPNVEISFLLLETVSAFGTVGFSASVTPLLSPLGKILICIVMYVGRLGPITFISIFNRTHYEKETESVRYCEEKIIIG